MHALVSDPGGDLDTCLSVSRSAAFQFPETVGFHFQYPGSYHQTTIIDFSGLNTEPASLIHLASDSRYRAYPQTSLLTCRLGFGQAGLVSIADTHPLVRINQFLSRMGFPRLWIYLGTTGNILTWQPWLPFAIGSTNLQLGIARNCRAIFQIA
jgi:hypothetical protein